MKKNKFNLFLLLIAFFLMILNNYSYTQKTIQKIISLGPGITFNLYLLGAENMLIGNTRYCIYPEDAKNKKKIGSLVKFDIEKVISMNPDIVLATGMANSKQLKKLGKMNIKTHTFEQPESFHQMCEHLIALGKLVNKEKKANKIVDKVKSRLKKILKKSIKKDKPKVFFQIGADPLFTVNKNSFLNDFIEFAGGINIAFDSKTGVYSREQVLKNNPDIIIITTMGIVGDKEKQIWQKHKTINAVKNRHIYVFDEYKLCSPSIVEFIDTLEEIQSIFRKVVNNRK